MIAKSSHIRTPCRLWRFTLATGVLRRATAMFYLAALLGLLGLAGCTGRETHDDYGLAAHAQKKEEAQAGLRESGIALIDRLIRATPASVRSCMALPDGSGCFNAQELTNFYCVG